MISAVHLLSCCEVSLTHDPAACFRVGYNQSETKPCQTQVIKLNIPHRYKTLKNRHLEV